MALYRSTVNYKLALCHLCAVFFLTFSSFICVSGVSLTREHVELCWACYRCELAGTRRVGLRKLVVSEHICKNNKVTKHELFNLQLLFTLVIFLAWGLRHILQEAGELLGYLLWDLTLNLSQACFNWNVLGLFRHISAFAIMSSNPFI